MKKFLNKLSNSGRLDVDSLREDNNSDEDEEHLDIHYRKPTALPADAKDTSQDIKVKKPFGSGSIGKESKESPDFSPKKKSSSSGIKKQKDKEIKDKDKLNESDDKSIKKSGSRKRIGKSSELKNPDSMKSPTLKGVFVSEHLEESDDSEDDNVPRSRENSIHDEEEFYTTTPIRVPSAPARIASPVPSLATRAASPRMDSPSVTFATPPSPQHMAYSPPSPHYAGAGVSSPNSRVPNLPRSASSPSPATSQNLVTTDEFDLRFGVVRERNDSISDETALGKDFARNRVDSVSDDVDVEMVDGGEVTNQKGKSGLFSFGNKAKKLK